MSFKSRSATAKKPHLMIDAGPGCGKTSTMIAGLNILKGKKPDWYDQATDEQKAIWKAMDGAYYSIGFQAFNKSIAEEIQALVPDDVKASTFHSHGYRVLRENGYNIRASANNSFFQIRNYLGYKKDDKLSDQHRELANLCSKIVSAIKNNLLSVTKANVMKIAETNGLEIDGNIDQIITIVKHCINESMNISKTARMNWIDFDDMIWLPIVMEMDFSNCQFDLLICDESQDLNPVQHKMVMEVGKRIICVGDPRQAIYAFRRADKNSMKTMERILGQTSKGVQTLPLQTSFRLPSSAVKNVSSFAPDLRAKKDAIEGEIKDMYIDEIEPKATDLVISRVNANIFSMAFRLLRKKVKVRIQGRDFGTTLKNIIKNNSNKDDTRAQIMSKLQNYDQKEQDQISKKQFPEKLLENHGEKMTCIYVLIENCETQSQMIETLEDLFDNNLRRNQIVLLSTVHRAKGLEANTVYILDPSLIPHPMAKTKEAIQQEYNIKFVAETRHKQTLINVHDREDEDE